MLQLGAGDVDRAILLSIYAGDRHWYASLAKGLSLLGEWHILIVLIGAGTIWLVFTRRYWTALVLLCVTHSGRMLLLMQKAEVGRPRPEVTIHLDSVHSLSFPSAHASDSMVVYLTLALLIARPGKERQWAVVAALLLTYLTGVSRVMLGVHWPSDVVAGWVFGLLWTNTWCHFAHPLNPSRTLLRK
jgi:undecaprenyl-diphosphatase